MSKRCLCPNWNPAPWSSSTTSPHIEMSRPQRRCETQGVGSCSCPPYSPDLNPIELVFSKLKGIRPVRVRFACFRAATPGHEFTDAIDLVSSDVSRHPCEPCLGVKAVHPGGPDEGAGDGSGFAATDGAHEEVVPAPRSPGAMGGDGADRALADVVVEFRPPIAEISTGPGHALWRVANGLCQPGPARKPCPKAWGVGPVARLPTHRRPAWPSPGAGQRVLRGICLWRRLRQHRDAQFVYSVSRNA